MDQIASWVTEHESLLSGLAAMIAIAALVPTFLRPILRRRRQEREPSSRTSARDESLGSKPRIAIFPIQTQPDEPDLQLEAERLTDEVTTLLARSSGCDVISSWSAASFAGGGGRAAHAGQELGVRYVLEGGMRSSEAGRRVTASLVDTAEDRVVWSDVFESSGEATDDVSRRLGERIAAHLGLEISLAEVERAERRPRSREARDLVLAAQGILFSEGHHRHTYQRAVAILEQATTKDPSSAEAFGLLALLYGLGEVFGFFEKTDAFREKLLGICRRALEIDDRSSEVLGYVGCAYCDVGHFEQGIPLLERAVSINPSNAQAKAALGSGYASIQRLEDAIAILENALDISPAFKGIAAWATLLARSYVGVDKLDEAAGTIERALRCDPTFFPAHLTAALIASRQGETATARRHVNEAYRIDPDLDPGTMARIVGPDDSQMVLQLQAGS